MVGALSIGDFQWILEIEGDYWKILTIFFYLFTLVSFFQFN